MQIGRLELIYNRHGTRIVWCPKLTGDGNRNKAGGEHGAGDQPHPPRAAGPRPRNAARRTHAEPSARSRGLISTYERSTRNVTLTTANTSITTTLCTTIRSRCAMA